MKSENDLLEWRRVIVLHQVVDEAFVFADGFGSFTIGNSGCLNDARVSAKIIDESNEAFVETPNLFIDQFFSLGDDDSRHVYDRSLADKEISAVSNREIGQPSLVSRAISSNCSLDIPGTCASTSRCDLVTVGAPSTVSRVTVAFV